VAVRIVNIPPGAEEEVEQLGSNRPSGIVGSADGSRKSHFRHGIRSGQGDSSGSRAGQGAAGRHFLYRTWTRFFKLPSPKPPQVWRRGASPSAACWYGRGSSWAAATTAGCSRETRSCT